MALRVQHFKPKALGNIYPIGTTEVMRFTFGVVEKIEVKIPRGHHLRTGIQIWYGDAQIIPYTETVYFSGGGRAFTWEGAQDPTGEFWSAVMFNKDRIDHIFQVSFTLSPLLTTGDDGLLPLVLIPVPLVDQPEVAA